MYSVLDPSKKFAEVGKRMISFSKPDAVSVMERSDATRYGTGLDQFFMKTAREQIEAPDLLPKPTYAGGEGEPTSEPKGEVEGEGKAEAEAKKVDYEDIGEGMAMVDYDNLNATASKTAINRAKLLKADARMEGLEVKVTKTKTKKAIIVEVTADKKRDLVKSFRSELKELVRSGATGTNYYNYVQYMVSGSAFKVIRETPAPSASVGGGASPTTMTASLSIVPGSESRAKAEVPSVSGEVPTSASKAVTTALEEEGGWIPVVGGKKQSRKFKLKGATTS